MGPDSANGNGTMVGDHFITVSIDEALKNGQFPLRKRIIP